MEEKEEAIEARAETTRPKIERSKTLGQRVSTMPSKPSIKKKQLKLKMLCCTELEFMWILIM